MRTTLCGMKNNNRHDICIFHDHISTKECTVRKDLISDRPVSGQASGKPTELPFLSSYMEIIGSIMTVIELCTIQQTCIS